MTTYGIVGATGETGKETVRHLCLLRQAKPDQVSSVHAFGRRELRPEDCFKSEAKKDPAAYEALKATFEETVVHHQLDFEELLKDAEGPNRDFMKGCQTAFCCLGTTQGKSGKDGFTRVDRDYIVESARRAEKAGVQNFMFVSAIGASAKSRFHYMCKKGETEDAIKLMNFKRIGIFKPGTLICERQEARVFESALIFLSKLDRWNLTSITTSDLAAGMVYLSQSSDEEFKGIKYTPTGVGSGTVREIYMADNVRFAAKFATMIGKDLSKRLSRSLKSGSKNLDTVSESQTATAASSAAGVPCD